MSPAAPVVAGNPMCGITAMTDDSFQIEIANQQQQLDVDLHACRRAIVEVLLGEGLQTGEIGLAIVDDATIWDVNKRHLDHDYPTDVISFLWDRQQKRLDGEVIVSAETALRESQRMSWGADQELLLYIVHGTLHLAGYDDQDPDSLATMRQREEHYMQGLVGRSVPRGELSHPSHCNGGNSP